VAWFFQPFSYLKIRLFMLPIKKYKAYKAILQV